MKSWSRDRSARATFLRFAAVGSLLALTGATGMVTASAASPRPMTTASRGAIDGPMPAGRAMATVVSASRHHPPNWNDAVLPGQVCGSNRPIHLHEGHAFVKSTRWPGTPRVHVFLSTVHDGALSTHQPVAALDVWCDNGGGTADGQLADSWVIESTAGAVPTVLGVLTPQQPAAYIVDHVPYFDQGKIAIDGGRIVVHELWYGPAGDPTCCPSGRAVSVWSFQHSGFVHVSTTVTKPPAHIPYLNDAASFPTLRDDAAVGQVAAIDRAGHYATFFVSCARTAADRKLPEDRLWKVDLEHVSFEMETDLLDPAQGAVWTVSRSDWVRYARTYGWSGFLILNSTPLFITNGPGTDVCGGVLG